MLERGITNSAGETGAILKGSCCQVLFFIFLGLIDVVGHSLVNVLPFNLLLASLQTGALSLLQNPAVTIPESLLHRRSEARELQILAIVFFFF